MNPAKVVAYELARITWRFWPYLRPPSILTTDCVYKPSAKSRLRDVSIFRSAWRRPGYFAKVKN